MVLVPEVLLVSGSLRTRSTNTAILRTAQRAAPDNLRVVRYNGLVDLPHFNPDDDVDPLPPAVRTLREWIHSAHAILFSTPEYAGALPGSFKNVLDWSIGDDQPGSMAGKPVAWLNPSTRGAVHAHDSLRRVLSYASGNLVEPACANIPVSQAMIDEDEVIADQSVRERIVAVLDTLVSHCEHDSVESS